MISNRFSCFFVASLALALLGRPVQAENHALLITVGEYPREMLTDASSRSREIRELHRVLRDADYDTRHLKLLDDQDPTITGKNTAPTAENIRRQLSEFLSPLTADDGLLVIVTGHTVQFSGEKVSYFCPAGADLARRETLLPVADIYSAMEKCAAGSKLLVYDACQNEAVKGEFKAKHRLKFNPIAEPQKEARPETFAILFSSQSGKGAFVNLGSTVFESHFLFAFLQAIKGTADDGDGELTMEEAVRFTTEFTEQRSEMGRNLDGLQQPLLIGKASKSWVIRTFASEPLPAAPLPGSAKPKLGVKAGEEWGDNGIAMKFRWCPAGAFWMGSPRDEVGRGENEDRVHVRLSGFYLGQFEVTQSQWQKVTNRSLEEQAGSQSHRLGAGPDYPIFSVSFNDAIDFCVRLNAQEREAGRLSPGWEYRLPTEAQWEYACRAGSKGQFGLGDSLEGKTHIGGALQAAKVGSYPPNAWGLCDLHGNVSEWCRDWYFSQLSGGRDPERNWPEFLHEYPRSSVHRGGDYLSPSAGCRSAYRMHQAGVNRDFTVGLRVALVRTER